jgi:putative SOS response-associated peptidase YedK
MCGRYTNDAELSDIRLTFEVEQVELFRDWKPTFNVTPSYGPGFEQLVVVRTKDGVRTLRLGRFWLIPPKWVKPLKDLPTAFNARAEDIEKKGLWREPFRTGRCLIPATGWREFKGPRGEKQPYHFHTGKRLFAFAGVSSRWTSPEGEVADTFAIITTVANQAVAGVHDRMPLVLPRESYTKWLDPDEDGSRLLREACDASLSLPLDVYPSDPIANSSQYEGPRAIEPVSIPVEKAEPVQGTLFGEEPASKKPPGRRRSG